jgi:CRP-like cAMP-binding protein
MTTSGAARDVSIEAILRVPLFVDLNKHEIQEIARLFKEHRFAKGETIVQEGSTGDTLFLIESGEAGVFIGGRGRTTMKSPDYFGEVALIDEGTRIDDLRLQRNLGGLDHHYKSHRRLLSGLRSEPGMKAGSTVPSNQGW